MSTTMSFRLVPTAQAPREARARVRAFLTGNGATRPDDGSQLQFVSALLTSELVTHAVEHGDDEIDDFQLSLGLDAGTLHTELSLDDMSLPIDVPPSDDRQIAYGLALIDSLARRWGGNHTGHGTCLWFDLDVDPPT
jgi:hypothetical protein